MNKIKYYIKKALNTFNQPEMRILPGNMAFFFVMALIPILTMVVVIASYFSVSIVTVIGFLKHVFPEEISSLIIDSISGKGFDKTIGAFNLIAFFIASNGTYSIIHTANTLYQVKSKDLLKDRVKAFILLFVLVFLIIFIIAVPLFGFKILSLFGNGPVVEKLKVIHNIGRWPLTIFMIYFNLKLIYTIAPGTKVKSSTTTYGAMFTTVIWTMATFIFSIYLKRFANYDIIYGNLSNLIILIMWLYIISYVFVMGMAINVTEWKEN